MAKLRIRCSHKASEQRFVPTKGIVETARVSFDVVNSADEVVANFHSDDQGSADYFAVTGVYEITESGEFAALIESVRSGSVTENRLTEALTVSESRGASLMEQLAASESKSAALTEALSRLAQIVESLTESEPAPVPDEPPAS